MTKDAVASVVTMLRERGEVPSHRKVLALLGAGSKRDVAKHLQALSVVEPGEPSTDPSRAPEGDASGVEPGEREEPNPVQEAQARAIQADEHLATMRLAMDAAYVEVVQTMGVVLAIKAGVTMGAPAPSDPRNARAQERAERARERYHLLARDLPKAADAAHTARLALEASEDGARQALQLAWVAAQQPALLAEQAAAERAMQDPITEYSLSHRLIARQALREANRALEAAMRAAPMTEL